jgi:hypothetical protein
VFAAEGSARWRATAATRRCTDHDGTHESLQLIRGAARDLRGFCKPVNHPVCFIRGLRPAPAFLRLEAAPALRQAPGAAPGRFDDVLDALRTSTSRRAVTGARHRVTDASWKTASLECSAASPGAAKRADSRSTETSRFDPGPEDNASRRPFTRASTGQVLMPSHPAERRPPACQ